MNIMKKLYHNLRDIDLFSVTLSFTYASKEKYGSSLFGSILTIIIVSIFVIKLVMTIKKLINKEDLDSEYQILPGVDDKIQLQSLSVIMCPVLTLVSPTPEYNNIFSASFSLFSEKEDRSLLNGTLSKEFCGGNVSLPDGTTAQLNQSCFCTNFNDTYYPNITNHSTMLSNNYFYITLFADFSNYIYNPNLEKFRELAAISFKKVYVDTSDYFNVFKSSDYVSIESIKNNTSNTLEMEVDKLQVDKVNDILSFGLFEPTTESSFNYAISKKQNIMLDTNSRTGSVSLLLKHSTLIKKYSIYSFNLENFLAHFGGYFQVFFMLFNLVSSCVNKENLDKTIEKNFTKTYNMHNSINKINQQIFDLRNREMNNDISSYRENEPKYNDNSGVSDNKINRSYPKRLSKYENDFSVRSKTFQNSQMEFLNMKSIFENKQYFKDIAEDFQAQLDYENYYYLIKEIKLIKFLLLDSKTFELFSILNNVPFNLGKFEKYCTKKQRNAKNGVLLNENPLETKLLNFKDFIYNN